LDTAIEELRHDLDTAVEMEANARSLAERMALTLQGALLVRHAPTEVAEAFCASRLANCWSGAYGTLPSNLDFDVIITRAQHP
jgi:putative acyl-CoA dehydrogenase